MTHIQDILETSVFKGASASSRPTIFIEAPHGATDERHYRCWEAKLKSQLPNELHKFFTMNTDIGSFELASELAKQIVANDPKAHIVVARCLIPRTFVDVNRQLKPTNSAMTPGLPPYIDSADEPLLTAAHKQYTQAVEGFYETICGAGGVAIIVHTYGPVTLDISVVDHTIVDLLKQAHEPQNQWPLRAEVDFITETPDGEVLSNTSLVDPMQQALTEANFQVARNDTYVLHPVSMGAVWAAKYKGQTVTLEVRRDLLVPSWDWDQFMHCDTAKVVKAAKAIAAPWRRA